MPSAEQEIMTTLDLRRAETGNPRSPTAPPAVAAKANTNADSNATAALGVLLSRQSHWPLTEPGLADTELDLIIDAALRAPHHGNLRPWRFVTIRGDARGPLGDLLVDLALRAALRARASSAGTSARREMRIRSWRNAHSPASVRADPGNRSGH
jgi:hypothetical protein